jgi:hypothetical protein
MSIITTSISTTREHRIIEVPVMGYVAKIIRKQYGDGVVHACHNTLLGRSIANIFADVPDEIQFPERPLPADKIKVEMNYRVARFYNRWKLHPAVELGIFYEKVVQRMMVTHVMAQVRCHITIDAAIDDFFTLYDLDEDDDYARASALQLYHKYKITGKHGKVKTHS